MAMDLAGSGSKLRMERWPSVGRIRSTSKWAGWVGGWALASALAGLLAGCDPRGTASSDPAAPASSSAARYGGFKPNSNLTSFVQPSSTAAASSTNPSSGPFFVLESELSPATLVYSAQRYLGLFTGLGRRGLGAPSQVAWSTPSGPRVFKQGDDLDVLRMEENWILVWFAGAAGWTNWDTPWAIYLQHRPASMKLDPDGLHLTFSNRADQVVLMPLYGAEKLPLKELDYRAAHGLTPRKVPVKTWEWASALPRDPLVRVRFWAGASRRLPLGCEEEIRVDGATESITARWTFTWRTIEDDWGTKLVRLAPLSPVLGLAVRDAQFPARFRGAPFDLGMATALGPSYGVPDADVVEASFSILRYLHETRTISPRGWTNQHAAIGAAAGRLGALAEACVKLIEAAAGGAGGAAVEDQATSWRALTWVARAAPHLEATQKARLMERLRSRLEIHCAEGGEGVRDPGPGFVEAAWAYAHFAEDYDWVRRRWPNLRRWVDARLDAGWATYGNAGIGNIGEWAGSTVSSARLAYLAGDAAAYQRACGRWASGFTHLWARLRGLAWVRQEQPFGSMEFIPENVFLTGFDPEQRFWTIDGPSYQDPRAGADTRAPRYLRRWEGLENEDVGRAVQDYLRAEARKDLAGAGDDFGVMSPSLLQARALLLGESPEALVPLLGTNAAPVQALAESLCLLQSGAPARGERLISGGLPNSFLSVAGGANEPDGNRVQAVGCGWVTRLRLGETAGTGAGPADWPGLEWPEWRTASGGAWTFGQIRGSRYGKPRRMEAVMIHRYTRMVVYDMP